mgnify:CR=1 FL=1
MSENKVREYAVSICDQCIRVEGEMCHNPECAFCRKTMAEVEKLLTDIQIRFVVDGEVIDLSEPSLVSYMTKGNQ